RGRGPRPVHSRTPARSGRDARGTARRARPAGRRRRRRRVLDRGRAPRALPERGAVPQPLARRPPGGRPLAGRAAPGRGQGRGAPDPVGPGERPLARATGQPVPGAHVGRDDPRQRALRRLRGGDRPESRHARRGVRDREPAGRRVPARLPRVEDRQGARRPGAGRGRAGHVTDDPVLEGRASVSLVGAGAGRRPPPPRRRREGRRTGFRVVGSDGLRARRARRQVPPAPERLVTLVAPEEVDALLGRALVGTPLFATRFRQCAIRALFIPRMSRGQRTPAYLQRLKADALLEAVGGQAEFPIVAETLRECFNDALDVTRLKRLLERLHDGEMWRRHVDTPLPSPFVYPLLLAW